MIRSFAPSAILSFFVFGAIGCSSADVVSAEPSPTASSNLRNSDQVDILDRIRSLPDVTHVEEKFPSQIDGARKFMVKIRQPVDHARPDGQTFEQRFLLWHVSESAPVVLYSTGYDLFKDANGNDILSDVRPVVKGNLVSMEYRYFGESIPKPIDWAHLTVKQSADDYHHVVTTLKSIYSGKWISHGRSKGGMTSMHFRSYYPDDVAGTVPIVAPHQTELYGPRYAGWFRSLRDRFPECVAKKTAYEREVLKRRDMIAQRTQVLAEREGHTFTRIPLQLAIEVGVKDAVFGWWTYFRNPAEGCSDFFPSANASDDDVFNFYADQYVGALSYSDQGIAAYTDRQYIYQTCSELGTYAIDEGPYSDLLRYPGEYAACYFAPDGTRPQYDPSAMRHVTHWLKSEASNMFFVYGGTDGFSGQSVQYAGVTDAHKRFIDSGPTTSHSVHFSLLTGADRTLATERVTAWAGQRPPLSASAAADREQALADDEPVLWPPKRYFDWKKQHPN